MLTETQDIKDYLNSIKDKVYLKWEDGQRFEVSDFHVRIGIKKGFLDPIAYHDYDPIQKKILGNGKELFRKLDAFFRHTNNHHLLGDLKKNLG